MNGRVLANAGVFALGIILIVAGGWAVWHGYGYVQLEWGWTSVIAGSVAATGGVLMLAFGFVLQRLDALHRVLLREAAGAGAMAQPAETFVAEEPANEPMPLGIETVTPRAPAPEPQSPTYPDPALQAAAAINLELLAHEERPPATAEASEGGRREITETAASEAPPEVIHAADQGPADDMVKAAGVGDEPELDAAIEELLAEERGGARQAAPGVELPPAVPAPALESPAPAAAPLQSDRPEKAPQRAGGWRGLFSRKDRRAPTPAPADLPDIAPAQDRAEQSVAEPQAEEAPAPSPAVHADAIPRTGDDWFDRALSGLDEVPEPYAAPGRGAGEAASRNEATEPSHIEIHAREIEPQPAGSAAPARAAVIGRYTSGHTTYVMFADGSIEAETPNGVLHFASLAELKVYVEGQ